VSGDLARRTAFAVIAAPLGAAILLYGDWPLAALLAITAALGARELFGMARATGLTPMEGLGTAIAGLIPLLVHARFLRLYDPEGRLGALSVAAVTILVVLAVSIWARGVSGKPLSAVAVTIFGAFYTGGMLSFGYAIRYHEYASAPNPEAGRFTPAAGGLLLLLPVFVTWASDIGAYAVGRLMGKHKLIPSVSPGKTIEGSIGGLIASMLVAFVWVQYVLRPSSHLSFKYPPIGIVIFGAILSVAAQIGDLAESLLKREAGVKDSSNLIPGHGGILDRFDSLFFVLPVAYVLIDFMLTWAP
jgi:phosphatidate cytidylyltransferase